jgi:hypothetical protein
MFFAFIVFTVNVKPLNPLQTRRGQSSNRPSGFASFAVMSHGASGAMQFNGFTRTMIPTKTRIQNKGHRISAQDMAKYSVAPYVHEQTCRRLRGRSYNEMPKSRSHAQVA